MRCAELKPRIVVAAVSTLRLATWVSLVLAAGPADGALASPVPTPWGTPLERAGYERIGRARGVAVFKHRRTDRLQLGAEALLFVRPRQLLAALLNYSAQVEKLDRLAEARVIERREGELVVYQRLDLPLIDDRDFTLRVRWRRRGSGWLVTYRTAPRVGPGPRAGVVRLTHHSGAWQLEPAAGGRATRVRYETSIDLAGLVPMWLVRSAAGDEIPEVVDGIGRLGRGR